MSHCPVGRRMRAGIERSGGWPAALERVIRIARSLKVRRTYFASPLHQDRDGHERVCRAREVLASAVPADALEMINGANLVRHELPRAKRRADSRVGRASTVARERSGTRQARDRINQHADLSVDGGGP